MAGRRDRVGASHARTHARRLRLLETRIAHDRLRVPLHVLWILCRLAEPRSAKVLWWPRMALFLRCAEGKLAQLSLDLSACVASCTTLCRVCVPVDPNAARRPLGV